VSGRRIYPSPRHKHSAEEEEGGELKLDETVVDGKKLKDILVLFVILFA
jgi:hypothetical protein